MIVYRTVYFSLNDPADVELLRLMLALPRSRRNRILKAALHRALLDYVQQHALEPLSPEAVTDALAAARRPRRRASKPGDERPAASLPAPPPRSADPVPAASPSALDPAEVERKLDRLLRTLTVSGPFETAPAEE